MDSFEEQTTEELATKRLENLKNRAKTMGITHSGNIGADALSKKINDHLEGKPAEKETKQKSQGSEKKPISKEQGIRQDMNLSQMKLIRVRIANMNPAKNDLEGEIVTIGNKFLGTVRKFVLFGEATDMGYHIPQIIYEELKSRKFQMIKTRKVKGQIVVDTRLVPEYSIEIMPQLSVKELKELADKQGAAERLGG